LLVLALGRRTIIVFPFRTGQSFDYDYAIPELRPSSSSTNSSVSKVNPFSVEVIPGYSSPAFPGFSYSYLLANIRKLI
jgi:hypothetical protein